MKIYIVSNLISGPWGGGNQFLKALKNEFVKKSVYSDSVKEADILIFNSYNEIPLLIKSFFLNNKKIVYRLGPVFHLYRKGIKWKILDFVTVLVANLFADLIIFQSAWSHEQAKRLWFNPRKKYSIILNAPDDSIFYKKSFTQKEENHKTKLVYSSWSSNLKKGFTYLKFLDQNLDFSKYEMSFIGNSPFEFKSIKIIKPLSSNDLAVELRKNDIYVSPVEDDACSNALLEGLASGLPAVALNSGGNPELIGKAGVLFKNEIELISGINEVSLNLEHYYKLILVKNLDTLATEYIEACKNI